MKKTNKLVRIISVLLTVIMMSTMLVACKKTDVSGESNTQTTNVKTNDGAETDANGYLCDRLPDDLEFNKVIKFLYWEDVENLEYFSEGSTGEAINDAIHVRNLNVKDRLKVQLEFVGTLGNYANLDNFLAQAMNDVGSGGEYDIFSGYSMSGAVLAINGLANDLTNAKYLDFEMPWWPHSILDESTVNGKLYFASGDISTNLLHMMYVVFFNQDMIKNNDLENPYDLVDKGEWTYSKMFEMSKNLYNDYGGEGKVDESDWFGFSAGKMHYEALFTGAGIRTVSKDSNGQMIVSPNFNSQKTTDLLSDICDFVWSSGDAYYGTTFTYGRTLFAIDRSYFASIHKDEMKFDYGILPIPKYDENQDRYWTCLANPFSIYAISVGSKKEDAAAATLECLASEGYRNVSPVLFENTMKYKYGSDGGSARMYDIIRESVLLDLGRIFDKVLEGYPHTLFSNPIQENLPGAFTSSYTNAESKMKSIISTKINPAYK